MSSLDHKKSRSLKKLSISIPNLEQPKAILLKTTQTKQISKKNPDPVFFDETDKNFLQERTLRHIRLLKYNLNSFDMTTQQKIVAHLKSLRPFLQPFDPQKLYEKLEDPFAQSIIEQLTPYTQLLKEINRKQNSKRIATQNSPQVPHGTKPKKKNLKKRPAFIIQEPSELIDSIENEKQNDTKPLVEKTNASDDNSTTNSATHVFKTTLTTLKDLFEKNELKNCFDTLNGLLKNEVPKRYKKLVRCFGQQLIDASLQEHTSSIHLARHAAKLLKKHVPASSMYDSIQKIIHDHDNLKQSHTNGIKEKLTDYQNFEENVKNLPSLLATTALLFSHAINNRFQSLNELFSALNDHSHPQEEQASHKLRLLLQISNEIKNLKQLMEDSNHLINHKDIFLDCEEKTLLDEHIKICNANVISSRNLHHFHIELFIKETLDQDVIDIHDLEAKSTNILILKAICNHQKILRTLSSLNPLLTEEEDKDLIALIHEREQHVNNLKQLLI
jgi:hypothetical protein